MLQDSGCALLVINAATADAGEQASSVPLLDLDASADDIASLEDNDLPHAPEVE